MVVLHRGSCLHQAGAVLVQGGSQAVKSISCTGRKVSSRSGQIVKLLSSAVESALASKVDVSKTYQIILFS